VDNPEQQLRYYAEHFRLVEVDSTCHELPGARDVEAWVSGTPEGFTFDVQAFALLTHHPTHPAALPPDLRPATGRPVHQQDLSPAVVDAVWRRFLDGVEPLRAAGRLGLLLFRFPHWFRPGPRTEEYLLECQQRCSPARICVEFCNAEWLSPRRAGRTLRFLTEHRLPYVCVDMPQGHPESLPPVLPATADVAVVRFHGRSPTWTGRDASARFRYHYSGAELAHWADRVRELSRRVRTTHVVFANGFRDDAQVDAARFQELLDTTTPMPRWRRVGCRTGHGGGRPGRPPHTGGPAVAGVRFEELVRCPPTTGGIGTRRPQRPVTRRYR